MLGFRAFTIVCIFGKGILATQLHFLEHILSVKMYFKSQEKIIK